MSEAPPTLPANANITHLKNQAKELKRLVVNRDPGAIERVQMSHPSVPLSCPASRCAMRRRRWHASTALTAGTSSTPRSASTCSRSEISTAGWEPLNNGMWDTIEDPTIGPDTPPDERETLLYSAYASAYHWRQVGNHANSARGEHLIARMAVKLGEGRLALRHARRCLELIEAHPEEMEDWDAAFGQEALARALAATGDVSAGQRHRDLAVELTAAVAGDGDREVLESELQREPWFGLC